MGLIVLMILVVGKFFFFFFFFGFNFVKFGVENESHNSGGL
jgi:hypothetical protein